MKEKQESKCAICGIEKCSSGYPMSVDHNHDTGKVRALLCKKCNSGLGLFDDDPELISKAVSYLESWA